MHPELITRVVNLVHKNGDKVVLADPTSGKAVVVIDLDAYEQLAAAASAAVERHVVEVEPTPMPVAQPVAYAPAPPQPTPAPATPAPAPVSAYTPPNLPVQGGTEQLRPQPIPAPVAPVKGPVSAEQLASAFGIPATTKKAQNSAEKGVKVTPQTMGTPHVMADLTQEQLIDKINRDIGAWKTAQETRRTDELRSVVQPAPQPAVADTIEEEERFFLEPIE